MTLDAIYCEDKFIINLIQRINHVINHSKANDRLHEYLPKDYLYIGLTESLGEEMKY